MFLKNRNIILKMKISKVTDYAALNQVLLKTIRPSQGVFMGNKGIQFTGVRDNCKIVRGTRHFREHKKHLLIFWKKQIHFKGTVTHRKGSERLRLSIG